MLPEQRAINRVFFDRQKLDCPLTFLNCFLLAPEGGIDHSQRADCLCVIGLIADDPSHLSARFCKSSTGSGSVAFQSRGYPLAPVDRKWKPIAVTAVSRHHGQGASGGVGIALAQREVKPLSCHVC